MRRRRGNPAPATNPPPPGQPASAVFPPAAVRAIRPAGEDGAAHEASRPIPGPTLVAPTRQAHNLKAVRANPVRQPAKAPRFSEVLSFAPWTAPAIYFRG